MTARAAAQTAALGYRGTILWRTVLSARTLLRVIQTFMTLTVVTAVPAVLVTPHQQLLVSGVLDDISIRSTLASQRQDDEARTLIVAVGMNPLMMIFLTVPVAEKLQF